MAEQSGLEYRLTELRRYLDEFQSRVDQLLDAWRRVAEMRHTLGSSTFFEDILARFEGELRTPWAPRSTDEAPTVDADAAPASRAARGEAATRRPAGNTTPKPRASGTAPRAGSRGRRPVAGRERAGVRVANGTDAPEAASADASGAGTAGVGATAARRGRGNGRSGATGVPAQSRSARAAKTADGPSTAAPSQRRRRAPVATESAATSERDSSRDDRSRGGRRTTRTAVLDAATAVGGEFGVSDLVDRIRESGMTASETAIRRVVLRMADAGQLARVGRGRYRLP